MDNCSAHPKNLHNLVGDNIQIEFLPPNTTALIQPMDQQVIYSLKSSVKKVFYTKLFQEVHRESLNENTVSQNITQRDLYKDFLKKYTLLDAIKDLSECWRK